MKNGVKMLDIAKKLGVSVVTVSNALAGRDGVSDAMRRKIRETADKMGYKPSHTKTEKKRALAPKPGKTVAILTSERFVGARGTFYWELTAGVSNALAQIGALAAYEIVSVADEKACVTPNSASYGAADGLLIVGQVSKEYVDSLAASGVPLLLVDFYDARCDVDSVISDGFSGCYLLTDYLFSKGRGSVGFVGNLNATSSINDRFLGYLKALIENGEEFRKDWRLDDRDDMGRLFNEFDFPEELPSAFVCNCDETAFRLISALKSKGVRVPEDVSVVGFDNYLSSGACSPEITTFEVDVKELARAAVDIMAKKLADPSYRSGKVIAAGKIIIKESVAEKPSKNKAAIV